MATIDARGQVCPIPVIRAKNALKALGTDGGTVEILVDNDISRQNLQKMASGFGYQSTFEQRSDGTVSVMITSGQGCVLMTDDAADVSGLVVAIGKNALGTGSDELGQILIKGFIYSLRELSPPPSTLVFFNSGVLLTSEGANTLEDLRELEKNGTTILSCGTCTNYYGISEKLAVGEITNMYGIVTIMTEAKKLINI